MNLLSVKTRESTIDFAISRCKIIFGNDPNFPFLLFRSLEQYFEKCVSTEYVEEYIGDATVYLDAIPMVVRDTLLFRIDPYFDFRNSMKMGTGSLLYRYAETLLVDIPYDDVYATVVTAHTILGDEVIAEILNIQEGDTQISFGMEPVTQKSILKLLSPSIIKDSVEAEQYNFTWLESIRLQLEIIARIGEKIDKDILVLYDGPLGKNGLESFLQWSERVKRGRIIIATSTPHTLSDLSMYMLVGENFHIDLADWRCFEEKIGMDIPWHWDETSLRSTVSDFISGIVNEKSLHIGKIFR